MRDSRDRRCMHVSLIAALAVAISSMSCTYAKKEQAVATVRGPIEASLVRVDKKQIGVDAVGRGHAAIIVPAAQTETDCELRVTKPTHLVVDVDTWCGDMALTADAEGMRLAWGPQGGPYDYVYFSKRGPSFDGIRELTEPIAWASVPSLLDALPTMLRRDMENEAGMLDHDHMPAASLGELVVDELAASGDGALKRALMATLDAPFTRDVPPRPARSALDMDQPGYTVLWRRALDRLDAADRHDVRRALLAVTQRPAPPVDALARALYEVDDVAEQGNDAALLARATELTHAKRASLERSILGVLLRHLVARKPKESGALACTVLQQAGVDDSGTFLQQRLEGAALLVVADTHTPCDAARALLRDNVGNPKGAGALCAAPVWFCLPHATPPVAPTVASPVARAVAALERALPAPEPVLPAAAARCSSAELQARFDALVDGTWPALRDELGSGGPHLFFPGLAAFAVGAGPLPGALERGVERQTYAWATPATAPDGRPRECSWAAPGERCVPARRLDEAELCTLATHVALNLVDGAPVGGRQGVLRFDDVARQRFVEGDPTVKHIEGPAPEFAASTTLLQSLSRDSEGALAGYRIENDGGYFSRAWARLAARPNARCTPARCCRARDRGERHR